MVSNMSLGLVGAVGFFFFNITSFVFLILLAVLRTKELRKYNEQNSDVYFRDVNELMARLKNAGCLGVTNVANHGSVINVIHENDVDYIQLKNGVAYVNYYGEETRFFSLFSITPVGFITIMAIGLIIRFFYRINKTNKIIKRAIFINSVMDYISGKDYTQASKKYNVMVIYITGHISSLALAIGSVLLVVLSVVL